MYILPLNSISLADIILLHTSTMSTLNERLLVNRNPDGMSKFLPLYTCANLL
jgi:hypothetical protein